MKAYFNRQKYLEYTKPFSGDWYLDCREDCPVEFINGKYLSREGYVLYQEWLDFEEDYEILEEERETNNESI